MLNVEDKTRCSGCSACVNACPVQCIEMFEDEEGFFYPKARPQDCIECGHCEQVCPYNCPVQGKSQSAYAVRMNSYEKDSASGGFLAALADKFLAEDGVVYGAVFDEELDVIHKRIVSHDEFVRLSGSKYVQSFMGKVFTDVRQDISLGKKVLFIGAPCQIAGLLSFLGGSPAELLTVEIACHGVPGPGIWRRYLQAIKKKLGMDICTVAFRDKSKGWKNYHISYSDGSSKVMKSHHSDPYMLAYLQNLSMRLSCYDCEFRGNRCGDISAGDFWNVSVYCPDYDDGKGVSLLSVNTPKGQSALECLIEAQKGMMLWQTVPEDSLAGNIGFGGRLEIPDVRTEFIKGYHSVDDVMGHIAKYVVRTSRLRRWYNKFHNVMSRLKTRILR